jgi:hypothetical protein
LKAQGSTLEQILLRLRAYNESRCRPPLPDEEIVQIARERSADAHAQSGRDEHMVGFTVASVLEPQDLRTPLDHTGASYPVAALGAVLGSAARRIHQVVQVPAALCGQSLLAAASLAAQAVADVEMDGRREPLSVYALSVGELTERKSHVDRIALTAHHERERAQLAQHRQDMQSYEIAREAHEAARRKACRARDPAAIRRALEALGSAPLPPATGIFLAPVASHEALTRLYAAGQASIGLFQDDARGLLAAAHGADEPRAKGAASLARLWDAGEIDPCGGEAKYFGRRLALHLMISPERAQRVLSGADPACPGLLARTLLVWPAAPVGERHYVEADLTVDPALVRYHEHIRALLARAPRSGAELNPEALQLEPSARAAWIAAHDALEASQGDEGSLARMRAWAGRAPAQILRIAGVLTLVEDPQAQLIRAEAIEQARVLVQHHLDEAARIVGRTSVPAEVRNAEALRDWCHKQGIRLLHSAAALQFGPRSVRTAAAFDDAIGLLERKGWAERVQGDCVVDGKRRRRAWHIAAPRQALS